MNGVDCSEDEIPERLKSLLKQADELSPEDNGELKEWVGAMVAGERLGRADKRPYCLLVHISKG